MKLWHNSLICQRRRAIFRTLLPKLQWRFECLSVADTQCGKRKKIYKKIFLNVSFNLQSQVIHQTEKYKNTPSTTHVSGLFEKQNRSDGQLCEYN